MKTLAERTQEALDEGFTVGGLAKAAGKSSAAVSQWLSGQTKSLKADSAAGLAAYTGWSATWWATGKGTRGQAATASAEDVSPLAGALAILGASLAANMPDDVRQDVADLLAKLAMRHGAARHQEELAALLGSVDVKDSPVNSSLGIALDHPASQASDHTSPVSPQIQEGGNQPEGGEEWMRRGRRIGQSIKPINATTAKGRKADKEKAK